jgi:endo-1,4-beta-mannosidase
MMGDPFVLGVNYQPRRQALYWWQHFDAGEVREDFALLHELGLTKVRVFLMWNDFQPTPDQVSPQRMAALRTVADIAAAEGFGLDVTFFIGHASGPNWPPHWLLGTPSVSTDRQMVSNGMIVDSAYRNPYSDPMALRAERLLIAQVVTELRDHPGIWMWNLGNEPDIFARPTNHAAGRAWVREMVTLIHALDPAHPVTCGLHMDSLHRDNGLRVDEVFAETDVAVMHSYPMYTEWARDPLDPDLAPFTCALVEALCGKPVLMEEWGGCTTAPGKPSEVWRWEGFRGRPMQQFMASEDDMAAYVEAVLPRLVKVGATGALLWCFADAAPELWERPPYHDWRHERFFGLVRPDGSLKPHAEVLRRFAATQPQVMRPPVVTLERLDPDAYYRDPISIITEHYAGFHAAPGRV